MDWIELLSTTARLLDAHDSRHKPGLLAPIVNEDRPGLSDGLWLDIATQLLEYLNQQDQEVSDGWVPLDGFVADMQARHPAAGLTKEDVYWVVNLLATPTRLTAASIDDKGVGSGTWITKATALVERPRLKVADRCRLSMAGRRTLQVGKYARDWIFAPHDAAKLVTAIEYNNFSALIEQTTVLKQNIRGFSHELTSLQERLESDGLREAFLARQESYLDAINGVSTALSSALELFRTKEKQQRYQAWMEKEGDGAPLPQVISQALFSIGQAVIQLRKRLHDLIPALQEDRRGNIVGTVNFDAAALSLAFNPPTDDALLSTLSLLGPWFMISGFPQPEALIGLLYVDKGEESRSSLIFQEGVPAVTGKLPPLIERFLAAHAEEIVSLLRQGKTISLSEAIRRGWLTVGGEMALGQLVGVYSFPDWLGDSVGALRVSLVVDALHERLPDGSILLGDELVLSLCNQEVLQ